jgi:hypothetical protein
VATVTYLTSAGAPLVVLTKPILEQGQQDAPLLPVGQAAADAFVVHPEAGSHVAFRGCFLHGCPSELDARPGERLSLLVNVWLRHRPLGLDSFPNAPGRALQPPSQKRWLALAADRIAAKRFKSFNPRTKVGMDKADAESRDVSIDFGPWHLSGLLLPGDAPRKHSSGMWAVRQARGQLKVALRATSRRPAKQTHIRKRPASAKKT